MAGVGDRRGHLRDISAGAMLSWRKRFRQRLDIIAERYPPRLDVDLDDVADMLSAIADGGIVVSKATGDKTVMARQIMMYRQFIRALFLGA